MSDCREEREERCCEKRSCHEKEAQECHQEGNLVEHVAQMWKTHACTAWSEVVTEILKEKIRKEWGAQLEKGAEAFVAAEGAAWQAKVAKAKAEAEFRKAVEKWILG